MDESVFSDERFLDLVVDASPAGMLIADQTGNIVRVNNAAEQIFGYDRDEMVGQTVEMLIPEAHHGDHASHRARFMSNPETRSMAAGRDLFGQRKDGSQVAVDISLHPFHAKSGMFVLANIMDATERRRVARERESRQAIERLALMGQLAGGVAHEIRTPLCVIRNDVYFLKSLASQLGEDGIECIDEIDVAVGKAERIVAELLDFTREKPSRMCDVDLQTVIDEAVSEVSMPPQIELRVPDALTPPVRVHADPEQIGRILANLVRNAVQAIENEGRIEITLEVEPENIWVDVADNGPGISPEQKERVFEPLYTTKPTGIGLGLALSRRYAQQNGGELIVTDRSGGGAQFRLKLRRCAESQ